MFRHWRFLRSLHCAAPLTSASNNNIFSLSLSYIARKHQTASSQRELYNFNEIHISLLYISAACLKLFIYFFWENYLKSSFFYNAHIFYLTFVVWRKIINTQSKFMPLMLIKSHIRKESRGCLIDLLNVSVVLKPVIRIFSRSTHFVKENELERKKKINKYYGSRNRKRIFSCIFFSLFFICKIPVLWSLEWISSGVRCNKIICNNVIK